MKVLVTGASGFIGSYLIENLIQKNIEVVALVRNTSVTIHLDQLGVEQRVGDIKDRISLEKSFRGIDAVFHLVAKISDWGPWKSYKDLTIDGTKHAIWAASLNGISKFNLVSSIAAYGARPFKKELITEESQFKHSVLFPWDYYCQSKKNAEDLAIDLCNQLGLKYTIFRPGMSFGRRKNTILSRAIEHIENSNSVYLIGGGENKLQLNYIENLVDAITTVSFDSRADNEIYNVCAKPEVTQEEFFKLLMKKTNIRKKIRTVSYPLCLAIGLGLETFYRLFNVNKRPKVTMWSLYMMANSNYISSQKLEKTFSWSPKYSFQEGMNKALMMFH